MLAQSAESISLLLSVNTNSKDITNCKRCGTCCTKGGPALHAEDRQIILDCHIVIGQLITIRKGELSYSPIDKRPYPVLHELVKIAGKGRSWECFFFDKEKASCAIYRHRPLECRILKCWDTTELLSVIGKDLLKRADIIEPGDPICKLIEVHEERCSTEKMEKIFSSLCGEGDRSKALEELLELVREDLSIRTEAASAFALPLEVELFMFGRPLFKLLSGRGISVQEKHGRIYLAYTHRRGHPN